MLITTTCFIRKSKLSNTWTVTIHAILTYNRRLCPAHVPNPQTVARIPTIKTTRSATAKSATACRFRYTFFGVESFTEAPRVVCCAHRGNKHQTNKIVYEFTDKSLAVHCRCHYW